jgi:hypothetical protein
MRVLAFDQVDFPSANLVLQRFLALDSFGDGGKFFVPIELTHFVFRHELATEPLAMFIDALISPLVTPM